MTPTNIKHILRLLTNSMTVYRVSLSINFFTFYHSAFHLVILCQTKLTIVSVSTEVKS